MNEHDLHGAFGDLARRGADDQAERMRRGAGIAAGDVVRRASRGRQRRAAGVSVTTLAVLGAAVLGGVAFGRAPEPQPAVPVPSPTTSAPAPTPSTPAPTPSETPARGTVLASGDPSLAFGACGSLATSPTALPLDDRFGAHVEITSDRVLTGQQVAVDTWVDMGTSAPAIAALPTAGATIAVVRDGVVVGMSSSGTGSVPAWQLAHRDLGGVPSARDWLAPVTCAPESQPDVVAGEPLPAGSYTLQPWAEVVDLGDDEEVPSDGGLVESDVLAALGEHRIVLGDPVPLVIEGEDATTMAPTPHVGDALTPVPPVDWPTCGQPAPTPSDTSLRLTTPASGTRVALADLSTVPATFEYVGPGKLVYREGGWGWLTLVRDGIVVGTSFTSWDSVGTNVLGSGIPRTAERVGPEGLVACSGTDPGLPELPSGEYQAFVHAFLAPIAYVLPDGTTTPGLGTGDWTFVVSDPFTLVVP